MQNWKVLTLAALSLMLAGAPVAAQNPIPNPGFETWSSGHPDGWMTSEEFLPGTVTQSADAHSGSSAVRGDVVEIFEGYLGQPSIQTGETGEGFLTSTRWGSLDGFYKLNSVGGDQILISALMVKGDSAIGGGSMFITAPAASYQAFSVPIFWATGDTPDTCILYAFLVGPSGSPTVHLGSYFLFDDLSMGEGTPPVCPVTMTGDVNANGGVSSSDIIYLVNFVFKAGPAPLPCVATGDVNCSGGVVGSADIIYLVNSVFKAGPAPCDVCTIIPGMWSCP